jgi:hypothetical protein
LASAKFNPKEASWAVGWRKYSGAYPFKDEGINIVVDDETGRLSMYNNFITTTECKKIDIKISQEKAIDLAKNRAKVVLQGMMKSTDYEVDKVNGPQLVIVTPNFWYSEKAPAKGEEFKKNAKEPRLVFAVEFTFKYVGNAQLHISAPPIHIWIDAETGDVIGGQ